MTAPLALVTGGQRRLGAAIALRLAQAGYALALHASRNHLDPELAENLVHIGCEWAVFAADFADLATPARLMAEVAAHFGRAPDLLVNNAAIFGQDRLENVDADALIAHFAINCAAPTLLTQAFAASGGGYGGSGSGGRAIVNLLDQRLRNPHADQFAYTLSKQALAGLTQTSARVLAPAIRVNAVAPGLTIATDAYDAAQIARLAERMPLRQLPQAEDIAEAVLYLARASAVTGQVIHVDAGAHFVAFDRDFLHLMD